MPATGALLVRLTDRGVARGGLASATLTRTRARAIFVMMWWTDPIWSLVRALSVAVVGFVMVAGAASAHEQRAHSRIHHPMEVVHETDSVERSHGVMNMPVLTDLSVRADCEEGGAGIPCSEDGPGAHMVGSCCTIACHAAVATALVGPLSDTELPGSIVAGLAGALAGRPSDRTERPPKRA